MQESNEQSRMKANKLVIHPAGQVTKNADRYLDGEREKGFRIKIEEIVQCPETGIITDLQFKSHRSIAEKLQSGEITFSDDFLDNIQLGIDLEYKLQKDRTKTRIYRAK